MHRIVRRDAPSIEPALPDSVREQPALADSASEELTQPVEAKPSFATFWDFAVAVNRSERAALALAREARQAGFRSTEGRSRS